MEAILFIRPAPRIKKYKNVVCVEECENEDGRQLLIFFDNGEGERWPMDEVMYFSIKNFKR